MKNKVLELFGIALICLSVNFGITHKMVTKLEDKFEKELVRSAKLEGQLEMLTLKGTYGVTQEGNETVITYGTYRGYPLQLVFEAGGRASLRIQSPADEPSMGGGDLYAMEFLKKEVERLVLLPNTQELGQSHVQFNFAEGFPIWGPHYELGFGSQGTCMFFAENATFEKNIVTVRGKNTKEGYWPYDPVTFK